MKPVEVTVKPCSIRELAQRLNTAGYQISHTSVRTLLKTLETETGNAIGIKQGKGKPTLLHADDQQLIIRHAQSQAEMKAQDLDTSNSSPDSDGVLEGELVSMHIPQSDFSAIQPFQPMDLSLQFAKEGDAELAQALDTVMSAINQGNCNGDLVASALIRQSSQKGQQIGLKMVNAKMSGIAQAQQQGDVLLMKQMGLIADDDIPDAQAS